MGMPRQKRKTGSPAGPRDPARGAPRRRLRGRRAGLTLTEIMVVLVILGLLASVLAVNYSGILGEAKHKIARQEISKLKELLEQYKLLTGSYPSAQEGLEALAKPQAGSSEPLLTSSKIRDPWGHAYVYVIPGQHGKYDLVCLGADGVEGGEGENADLHSWEDAPTEEIAAPATP